MQKPVSKTHFLINNFFTSVALCELGTSCIETVLLAFPANNAYQLEDFKEIWETLEKAVHDEKVFSLGVADLNKDQLEELYNWAKVGFLNRIRRCF